MNQDHESFYTKIEVNKENSIKTNLSKFPNLDDTIRYQADYIYQDLDLPLKRGKKNGNVIYYCVFEAFNQVHGITDPVYVAKQIEFKICNIGKSFRYMSGIKDLDLIFEPEDLVFRYCELLELPYDSEALDLLKKIDKKEIVNINPKYIALGAVLCFVNDNDINFDEIKEKFEISKNNITKYKKQLSKLLKDC